MVVTFDAHSLLCVARVEAAPRERPQNEGEQETSEGQ